MDPYAAAAQPQTYQPSSQIQPQTQDSYIYNQQQYDQSQQHYDQSQQHYDPSQQHYVYYTQPYDQSQQYDPNQQYDPSQQYVYQQPAPGQEIPQQPQPEQEHAPIHPPGVPVQTDPNQIAAYQQAYAPTHYPTDPNSYYYAQPQPQQPQLSYPDPGMVHPGQQQWQQPQAQPAEYGLTSLYPPNGQPSQYSAPSRGGGRGGYRGGSSSSRGRGRGGGGAGGRGGAGPAAGGRGGSGGGRGAGAARGDGRGAGGRGGRPPQIQPKPQFLAWCELCRVDCNTHEVLENHKNGKKHKKNLEIQEDLKKLAAKSNETQMPPSAAIERPPEVKLESQTVPPSEEQNNLKRKMVDEERKSVEPIKKPKESVPVPFICELCDVKCESAPVFDCHLKGRKHSFNLQRFQEQQAALGQVALQALYPALEAALYPMLIQALAQNASTSYGYNGGLDQHVLQLLQPYLPQNGPGYYPPGPGFQPHHGPIPGVNIQPVEDRVEPVNGTESKTEDKVEPEVKTENGKGPESKTEDGVGPESKAEEQVEPEVKTEDQKEPEIKTEDQVEPEQAGPIAVEGTQ